MKNAINVPLVRIFGIIAIVAVIGISFAACGGGGAGRNAYNGTWVDRDGDSITVSANELKYDDIFYTMIISIDSVTAMTDDNDPNYPSGFRFDGKIKEVKVKDDNFSSMADTIGEEYRVTLWMHTGKKELKRARTVYKKQ